MSENCEEQSAYSGAGAVLGRRIPIPTHYAPELLQRVDRAGARSELPHGELLAHMAGVDVWHAYEASCLIVGGLPVVAILKVVLPSSSQWVVESKSLKLYLHSLMNEVLGETPQEAMKALCTTVANDLGGLLGCSVAVVPHGMRGVDWDFGGYRCVDGDDERGPSEPCVQDVGAIAPHGSQEGQSTRLVTHLLRSNCPITGQPDWGEVYVRAEGGRPLEGERFRDYVVGLRSEAHFHEAICERIFTDILWEYAPQRLMVVCLYTRRGGIDICPCRATDSAMLPPALVDAHILTRGGFRS